MKRKLFTLSIWIVSASVILAKSSHAYIDPGTGSYFIQMLIAGLLGALFAVKIFWTKIKDFFKNLFRGKKDA